MYTIVTFFVDATAVLGNDLFSSVSHLTFVSLCLLRKYYPGVCDGIFFDEAPSGGLTDADGSLTDIGQLYFDYNAAAIVVVRGCFNIISPRS